MNRLVSSKKSALRLPGGGASRLAIASRSSRRAAAGIAVRANVAIRATAALAVRAQRFLCAVSSQPRFHPPCGAGWPNSCTSIPRSHSTKSPPRCLQELAALYQPIAAGVSWAHRVPGTQIGDTVVVFGAGQRGIACALAAREAGAAHVAVVARRQSAHRLKLAEEFGADATIFADEDVAGRVRELTRGEGADVVIDVTAQTMTPIVQAIDLARDGRNDYPRRRQRPQGSDPRSAERRHLF